MRETKTLQESYEANEAFEGLKIIWFIRGSISMLCVIGLLRELFTVISGGDSGFSFGIISVLMMLFCGELFLIVQFFRKNQLAFIGLHGIAAILMLIFPIGTALSVLHFIKARHLKWK